MLPEITTPPVLVEVEEKLKDRFKDYLVVATDGSEVYCVYSSHTAAIGLSIYARWVAEEALFGHA